jgi:acyl carrier protein
MDIRSELMGLFKELGFDPADIGNDTLLRDELAIDSTELVEIAVAIERRVSVSIDNGHFQALETFGELVDFVQSAPVRQAAPVEQ